MKDTIKTIAGLVSFFLTCLSVFAAVKKKAEIEKEIKKQ